MTDSYGGLLQPGVETAIYGPFTITSANGCAGATIDVTASTGGGRAPQLIIQQQLGASWQPVATSYGSSASYSGSVAAGENCERLHIYHLIFKSSSRYFSEFI
ncbi:hypothetical protein HX792_22575 [Pseudomonas sp. B6002]|uniref:hypothetical protein n=1 Tax=Pseudomonas sp. B6002 TaxID=2726978 RepID=UPI0015A36716|nr:hypothetical protein [Pseudomonas sp. B6002]NVZ53144.1 hypothetical protein [Pseudomonas sp. B6002]